jgi:hypothetical protein
MVRRGAGQNSYLYTLIGIPVPGNVFKLYLYSILLVGLILIFWQLPM